MRVALIVCGQMRKFDLCFKTWEQYLFPHYECDVFVATQDVNALKGRIYINPVILNQYIFQPITYDIEQNLGEKFGSSLKGTRIREGLYETYIGGQDLNFVLTDNFGWAENFLDMNLALDMAGFDYDLYIKIRPDICLCKDFVKITNVPVEPTMWVNHKNDTFIWDAVFVMNSSMAHYMKGYYDYYKKCAQKQLSKCFNGWDCRLNCEEVLFNYVGINNCNVINLGAVGYPFTWILGDIKNNFEWSKREQLFSDEWKQLLIDASHKYTPCYFDLRDTTAKPLLVSSPHKKTTPKKTQVALLICGQSRDYAFCIQSLLQNCCSFYSCDIYIVTQDSISIKPRLGRGFHNQYMIAPFEPDFAVYERVFGNTAIKFYEVRKTYKDLIRHQNQDLTLCNMCGWQGQFDDFQLALSSALNSEIDYKYFIKARPDILLTRPFVIPDGLDASCSLFVSSCDEVSMPEALYGMTRSAALKLLDFPDWYKSEWNTMTTWNPSYNTEAKLMEFTKLHNISKITVKSYGLPVHWLISDIRNSARCQRHRTLEVNWRKALQEYEKDFKQVIFDLEFENHIKN